MNKLNPHEIGQRIKLLRKMNGERQLTICKITGVQPSRLSKYESGKERLSLNNSILLARYFDVTLDHLFLGDLSGVPFAVSRRILKEQKE